MICSLSCIFSSSLCVKSSQIIVLLVGLLFFLTDVRCLKKLQCACFIMIVTSHALSVKLFKTPDELLMLFVHVQVNNNTISNTLVNQLYPWKYAC